MKILIAEDDIVTQKVLEYCLKEQGHEIETANNGDEGIELLESWKPDLVITDVLMPHVNGLELLSHLRNNLKSNIPCIIISVLGQEYNIAKADDIGATDYLVKPIDTDELIEMINKYTNP